MAGPYDRDSAAPVKAPITEQAKTAGKAAAVVSGKAQAKTQAEYTKTLAKTKSTIDGDIANAKKTLQLANKKGTADQKAAAKDFYDTLVGLKPLLDKLGPDASNIYKGDLSALNGGTGGTGGGGMGGGMGGAATGGKGAYSLSQIRAYMDANGGDFPPDLNTIASGITAADLTNLMSDYRSGRPTDDKSETITKEDTTRTLGKDVFKSTLALMLGSTEAAKPWVNEIYGIASGFYKSGSTIEEALNFSIYEAKNKGLAPEFTKRFQGVFDLQARLQGGEAIEVPTIAQFIKAESDMGTTLREAGLGDLATQEFLGSVIGKGKSVLEVGNLISQTFSTIDNAPAALKTTLSTYFPSVDRVSLAKALLTGEAGAAELDKKVKAISVLSAAGSQGITVDLATAGDIAARGFDYEKSLTGFGQVKDLQRADTLARFEGGTFNQQQSQKYVFEQNQAEKERLRRLSSTEEARFAGSSGLAASALRGRTARGEI
jgi:hypothetical protein